jgi:hypothetical protein
LRIWLKITSQEPSNKASYKKLNTSSAIKFLKLRQAVFILSIFQFFKLRFAIAK